MCKNDNLGFNQVVESDFRRFTMLLPVAFELSVIRDFILMQRYHVIMSCFDSTLELLLIFVLVQRGPGVNINVQQPILLYKNGSSSFATSASFRQYSGSTK